MSRIIKLTVSNILRLKAAEVTPDGALVVVAGKNDQGKSSLLNSIALALSGRDVPQQPIRQGASQGYVILETEDLVVTRTFSQTGGSKLEVRDRENAKVSSPQQKLDTLTSRVAFDPLEFTKQPPDKQAETVRRIAGLDFTGADSQYATIYAQRTEKGRAVKQKEGELQSLTRTEAPAEEISVAALTEELQAAQAMNAEHADMRDALSEMCDDVDTHTTRVEEAKAEIERLQEALAKAGERLTHEKKMLADQIKMWDEQRTRIEKLQDVPVDPILARMRDADATNAKVRTNRQWSATHKALTELRGEYSELTVELESIEGDKAKALAEAKFPVDGLGFTEGGVTFKGVPFEQAGSAVKIRVSLAIARSLNPELPVMLIRDGSLLDENTLKMVADYADEHGCQVWLEKVSSDADGATVFIEDGQSYEPATRKKSRKANA